MKIFLKILLALTLSFFSVSTNAQLFENFEQGNKGSYAPASVTLETGEWFFSEALIGTLANDKKNGSKSVRIQNGYVEMRFNYPNGFLDVSFYAANYGTDTGGAIQVSYSIDDGNLWTTLGNQISLTATLTQYTVSASISGNVRLKFEKKSGNRINLDDVLITDYIESIEQPTLLVRINDAPYENGSTFDFGLNTGIASASIQLRNAGVQDLTISSYHIVGDEFAVEGDMELTLSNLETYTFTISYESISYGVNTGSLTIFSNDTENPEFTINLTAETLDTSKPIPINEARKLPQGTFITVSGWITVSNQFAGPVYLQDNTGGIAWYSDEVMRQEWLVGAIIGDSIVLKGELGNFNNLLQIINQESFEVFHESNYELDPIDITLDELNSGNYEAMLVRITDIDFTDTGVFSGGTNYSVTDPSGQGQVRIDNFTNIPGSNIPNGLSEITGVAGRYQATHQLMPRFTTDIVDLSGPVILTIPPYEVSSTANSITLEWETELAGHSEIRYGTTSSLELGAVVDDVLKNQHSITLPNLSPATAYIVQLRSAFDTDTSTTALYITSTGSPSGSTGEILTFFNKDVSHNLATYREADQNVNFAQKLIEYIQMAEETAEFAFYSLSGNVGNNIADEIVAAHNRGVDVRVIATGHTGTVNEVITFLTNSGVNAVQSLGVEQMHNKFAVFDAHHNDPSKPRIVTSSWNATDQGTYDQYQNMVIIQDVALTRAYWHEFNQMWGGQSGAFNASKARFGPNKSVVNPSVFWIGDNQTRVEVYFSPQANTEAKIIRALTSAQENINLTLNLITRRTISNAMLNRFNDGVKVRGTIGVTTGTGTEWDYLSAWADVHHFSQGEFGLLHHKYAIIDGETTSSNSKVITGSHNWSANANFNNDENTLIISNPRVANEYFQEFAARYWQAGGDEDFNVSVSIDRVYDKKAGEEILFQNYPNPFSSSTTFQYNLPSNQRVTLSVYDTRGRKVATLINAEHLTPGTYNAEFDLSFLANGLYIYTLQFGDGSIYSRRMFIVK